MSSTRPSDGATADRQPDLFDRRASYGAERVRVPIDRDAGTAASRLTDGELVAILPEANLSNVETLCAEVVSRSLHDAVPALESLWRRFAGFGIRMPFVEQRAVLSTLGRIDADAARTALREIILSKSLPASLLPFALRAATQARLALPTPFVAPLLSHPDAAVREPAFALSSKAGVSCHRLRDGLTDPSASVRRLAAIAMGMRGDAEAREALIVEIATNPSLEVIEALAATGDDDAIVHLGRCAERHPALAGAIVDMLRDMESAKADRLARHLERRHPATGSGER